MNDTGDLTHDAFLGGRVHLWQPKDGYRAGIDPVLLAASVPAEPGQTVLDLGCGAGAASLCLHVRVEGLILTGIERQVEYAELARRNVQEAEAQMDVVEADIGALPADLRQRSFDFVIANPPYYDPSARSAARDAGREAALAEDTPLPIWIDAASRRLGPKGWFHVIQRADRLPDLLSAATPRLGSIEVIPISGRDGRPARLILMRARKAGRAAFRLHAPVVLHDGDRHENDGESYRPDVQAIFRDAAPLLWPSAAQK